MSTSISKSSKDQKVYQVAVNIFALEESKGHLKWKVTDLERVSGVSRTLIYRYFGNSKKKIFHESINVFLCEFYGFGDDDFSHLTLPHRVARARDVLVKYPSAIIFYQKWRNSDHPELKKLFADVETKFRKKIKKLFPSLSSDELETAYACLHGLTTAPFLDSKMAQKACAILIEKDVFKV